MVHAEQPKVNINISNKEVYRHVFKCHNVGQPTRIVSKTSGCSCTLLEAPTSVDHGTFEIIMEVDKKGGSGFYSVNAKVVYESGTIDLQLNGKLDDTL